MLSILFWNINQKELFSEIATLCDEHQVDLLILAEATFPESVLQVHLNSKSTSTYLSPFNPSDRIQLYTRLPSNSIGLVSDYPGLAFRAFDPIVGPELLIVCAHLNSKLHVKENEQALSATRIMRYIVAAEEQVQHSRTLIIGDLNMNPFEDGVTSSEGLHGVMDRQIALRFSRTVQGESRKLFYNPMWSLLGDRSVGPPGTYYNDTSGIVNYFWHTFDQVLLRPDLLSAFENDNLQVLTSIGTNSLLKNDRINSKYSDHLPLLLKLNFL